MPQRAYVTRFLSLPVAQLTFTTCINKDSLQKQIPQGDTRHIETEYGDTTNFKTTAPQVRPGIVELITP